MSAAVSLRTQVRDAFVAALQMLEKDPASRIKGAEIVTDYLHESEIKKAVSYGVIVTDEHAEEPATRTPVAVPLALTVLIVVYVRSETDRRALLDAALEDVWETLRAGQRVQPVVPYLQYDGSETDEAATAAKPYAQAKMRWIVRGLWRTVSW